MVGVQPDLLFEDVEYEGHSKKYLAVILSVLTKFLAKVFLLFDFEFGYVLYAITPS